jgi:diacylglycerol kinase
MMRLFELVRGVVTSCSYALQGVGFALRSQRNFRLHMLAAVGVLVAGGLVRLSRLEYTLLVVTVMVVILGELINTAVEFILNLMESRGHPVVRAAKDIAAGGVLMAVLGSVIVGVLLFGPRLLGFVRGGQ